MPPNKYWVVYVGVFVPLFIAVLSIVLVVVVKPPKSPPPTDRGCTQAGGECQHGGTCEDGKCKCPAQWTGDRCQTVAVPPVATQAPTVLCGVQPHPCASDVDCLQCGGTVAWACTELTGSDNRTNLSGKYCLPAKPAEGCGSDAGPGKYSQQVPGVYMWQGWTDVNTQKWSCVCEYPQFYPPALGSGACTKAPEVCKFGKWHFPCIGKACDLTDDEARELSHASPLLHGYCQCDNVPCASPADCASNQCENGVCVNQRVSLNARTGVPECVVDTCAPYGKWVGTEQPPYVYGRCQCDENAADTGFGCTPSVPPPPVGTCPQNCTYRGHCLPNNTCACFEGYSGEACETPVCVGGCAGRGKCEGPNRCTCERNTVYNAASGQCLPFIACTPAPAVDAQGKIVNSGNFSVNGGTGCASDLAQANALCIASGYTRADDLSTCFRAVHCSGAVCDDAVYCNSELVKVTGPIAKVRSADERSCSNPSIEQVNALCQAASPKGEMSLVYNTATGLFMCVNTRVQYTLTVTSVVAEEQLGLQGTFCVAFATEQEYTAARARDGGGLFAKYSLTLTSTGAEVAGGMLDVKELQPSAQCRGYYYSFGASFLSTQDVLSVPADTMLSLRITTYPLNRWSCISPDLLPDLANCNVVYANSPPGVVLVLQPYQPEPGYSIALKPLLLPEAAKALTQSSAYMQDAVPPGSVVDVSRVKDGTLVLLPTDTPDNPVVQVACTNVYCRSGEDVTASVLTILAWAYERTVSPSLLGAECVSSGRNSLFIKYDLTRTSGAGAPVQLLGPTLQPRVGVVGSQQVAYFVDILPAVKEQEWTYTLNAYVVADDNDTTTSYNTAVCRSDPQTLPVVIKPYTNDICNQIPAPEPDELPLTTWLNKDTGVCYWEPGNKAAIDYYCAVQQQGHGDTFPYNSLHLADNSNNCKQVGQSYPTVVSNWKHKTCTPEYIRTPQQYTCGYVYPTVLYALDLSKYESQQAGGESTYVRDARELLITVNDSSVTQPFVMELKHEAPPVMDYVSMLFNLVLTSLSAGAKLLVQFIGVQEVQFFPTTTSGAVQDYLSQVDAHTVLLTWTPLMLNRQLQFAILFRHAGPPAFGSEQNLVRLACSAPGADSASFVIEQVGYTKQRVFDNFPPRACLPSATGEFTSQAECEAKCEAPKLTAPTSSDQACRKLPASSSGLNYSAQEACQGTKQDRAVKCHKALPFTDGNGQLDDEDNFKLRMQKLSMFYEKNIRDTNKPLKNESYLLNAEPGKDAWSEMYNMYYHCGPLTEDSTYGSTCSDPQDVACRQLQGTCDNDPDPLCAQLPHMCAGNNVCLSWTTPSYQTENEPVFTQTRTCFPSDTYVTNLSPCCDCRGAYSITNHSPLCKCLPGEESCNFPLLPEPVTPSPGPPSPDPDPSRPPAYKSYTLTVPNWLRDPMFPGPGHPKGSVTKYQMVKLGSFTLDNYTHLAIRVPAPEQPNVFLNILSGKHASGTDEAKIAAWLLEGEYNYDWTQLYSAPPPVDKLVYPINANRTAERKHAAVVTLNTPTYFCAKPNRTYTLLLVITYEQGKATDETLQLTVPSTIVMDATNDAPPQCPAA